MTERILPEQKLHVGIIGATSGIGFKVAERLLSSCNVSVFGRRLVNLVELQNKFGNLFTHHMDVQDTGSIERGLNLCVEKFGVFDALIYCAGLQVIKPHRNLMSEDVDALFNVNLRGAIIASKLFCSSKVSKRNAVMCFISSVAASKPESGIVAYSVMKAGINALTKGLARECAPRRFVAVAPGWLDTEMTQRQPLYSSSFIDSLAKKSPLGLTSVDNIVDGVEFLISNRASSITGINMRIDGGASL
jgi:NAD(P)-dependent dehydrogenase (short-subunit alcohol dehydrogenase family)